MKRKTKPTADQKKQYTIPATSEVKALVTRISNKYARAVVAMNPTDDNGPMDAGVSDCALFTSALSALDERLDPNKPANIVEFVNQFKKKRGPHSNLDTASLQPQPEIRTPQRKRAVSATPPYATKKKAAGSL